MVTSRCANGWALSAFFSGQRPPAPRRPPTSSASSTSARTRSSSFVPARAIGASRASSSIRARSCRRSRRGSWRLGAWAKWPRCPPATIARDPSIEGSKAHSPRLITSSPTGSLPPSTRCGPSSGCGLWTSRTKASCSTRLGWALAVVIVAGLFALYRMSAGQVAFAERRSNFVSGGLPRAQDPAHRHPDVTAKC